MGDFSTVNGTAATGTVVLDPITGAIDPSWDVDIENRLTSGVRTVTTVDVYGDFAYIAGGFTHVGASPTSSKVYARSAARIQWATGTPDGSWNPAFNGTVIDNDMSANGDRMYAAGFFTSSLETGATTDRAAAVLTVPGAPVEDWSPVWSNSGNPYQQAIQETGNRVFVGGAEHSLFSWDTTTFERTSGSTGHGTGGDFQAIGVGHGVVYGGSHARATTTRTATPGEPSERRGHRPTRTCGSAPTTQRPATSSRRSTHLSSELASPEPDEVFGPSKSTTLEPSGPEAI